jgi:dephospho-CoA kinase
MTEPRDETERLRAQLENLSESHIAQRVLIAAMSEERDGMTKLVEQAAVEIERLRKERDEARREVCYASTQPPRECAEDRGWDCFKEADK